MRILDHLTLYRSDRFHAAFPAVAAVGDDGLLLVFRRAPDARLLVPAGGDSEATRVLRHQIDHIHPRSHHVSVRLGLAGKPVAEPLMLEPDPEAADQDASLLARSDGSLMLFSFGWYPLSVPLAEAIGIDPWMRQVAQRGGGAFLFWGGHVRMSKNQGSSWSERSYLPPVEGARDVVPGIRSTFGGGVRGGVVETGDGDVLVASYWAARPEYGMQAHLFRLEQGTVGEYRGIIAADPAVDFFEPSLYRTPSGRLIAFMRTGRLGDRLATVVSGDGGATWSGWRQHDVIGHPYHALGLKDGRVLLTYGYRHAPFGIRARVLDPECTDIDSAREHVVWQGAPCGDVGYPWAAQLPDGGVMVTYYTNGCDGLRHIAGTLLELD